MKARILAGGYATRLYPLTKNQPKPLLRVAGKTIAEYLLDRIFQIKEINQVFLVTNDKFAKNFEQWVDEMNRAGKYNDLLITVVNDGTFTNETRLGAIGDIQFVLNKHNLDDDMLIIAGDNIFTFDFNEMTKMMHGLDSDVICAVEVKDINILRRGGVLELDGQQRVVGFQEKPSEPKSNFACPAFYIYKKGTLQLINEYLVEGNDPDAPGHFIPWLIKKRPVYAYIMTQKMYDIGNLESYERVRSEFGDISPLNFDQ